MAEDAQAMVAELASEERIVAERAAKAFVDYVQAFAEQRLQERQLALLSRMGQAVRARYTTGGAGLADAARIDVEVAKAERALARVAGDIVRVVSAPETGVAQARVRAPGFVERVAVRQTGVRVSRGQPLRSTSL
jgi:hypothetical protein